MNPKILKPGLVASYDLRPGNKDGQLWFRHIQNLSLTYFLRQPTCSPGTHMGWLNWRSAVTKKWRSLSIRQQQQQLKMRDKWFCCVMMPQGPGPDIKSLSQPSVTSDWCSGWHVWWLSRPCLCHFITTSCCTCICDTDSVMSIDDWYIGTVSLQRHARLVSWSLTSLFSTNMAVSEQKVSGRELSLPSKGRPAIY